jgi:tetratricopeptide (TPR) repeat protein
MIKKHVIRSVMGVTAGLMLSGCALDLIGWNTAGTQHETVAAVTASATLEMARSAYNNGNYGIAISHLERELADRPESIAALNGLGAAYDQIGRFEVAQRYYFRALELAPDPTATLANLGYSNQLQGKPGEALQILELALYYGPHNKVANANMQAVARQLAVPPAMATSAANTINAPIAQTISSALRVEISNGNGVNGMAARVRSILQTHSGLRAAGGEVVRLTNADSFNHRATTVHYRSGQGAAVTELINSLPLQDVRFEESDQMTPGVDVRVLLGSDYIPYDSRG